MDPYELNCNSRQQIVDWLATNTFPLALVDPKLLPKKKATYTNAWHFAGRFSTDTKMIRIFRPGPYTNLNVGYSIAVIEEAGTITFEVNNLVDTDTKYGTHCRTAIN